MSELEVVLNPHTKKGWYIRRVPYTRDHPTHAQMAQQRAFAQAAMSAFDETGYRMVNGELLPPAAAAVKNQLSGKKLSTKPDLLEDLPPAELTALLKQLPQKGTIRLSTKAIRYLLKPK